MVKPTVSGGKRSAEELAAPPQVPPRQNPESLSAAPTAGSASGVSLPARLQKLRSPSKDQVKTVQTETDQLFTQKDHSGNIVVTLVDRQGLDNPFVGPAIKMMRTPTVSEALKLSGIFEKVHQTNPNETLTTTVHTKNNKTMQVHNYVIVKIPTKMENNTAENRKRFGELLSHEKQCFCLD